MRRSSRSNRRRCSRPPTRRSSSRSPAPTTSPGSSRARASASSASCRCRRAMPRAATDSARCGAATGSSTSTRCRSPARSTTCRRAAGAIPRIPTPGSCSCRCWSNRTDLRAAANAAERAFESAPARPEALLAVAYTSYRLGRLARADSVFVRAIPLLPPVVRARFDDISPVASERDTATLRRLPTRGASRVRAAVLEGPRPRSRDRRQRGAARVPRPRRARLLPVLQPEAARVGPARRGVRALRRARAHRVQPGRHEPQLHAHRRRSHHQRPAVSGQRAGVGLPGARHDGVDAGPHAQRVLHDAGDDEPRSRSAAERRFARPPRRPVRGHAAGAACSRSCRRESIRCRCTA